MISKERFELTLQQIKDSVAPDYVGPKGWGTNERGCIVHEIMKRHGLVNDRDEPLRPMSYDFGHELTSTLHSMIRMNDNGVRWHAIIDWATAEVAKPAPRDSMDGFKKMMDQLYAKPPVMQFGWVSDPLTPVKEEELVNA